VDWIVVIITAIAMALGRPVLYIPLATHHPPVQMVNDRK